MSENGEVAKQVTGTLSQEGCFDTLELRLENNTGLALVLDVIITGMLRRWKKVRDYGKCQLAALPASAGVTGETDDNGLQWYRRRAEMKVEYRYDSEGYPLGKTTINSQNTRRSL